MHLNTQLQALDERFYIGLPLRTLSTCMKIAKKEKMNLIDRLMERSLPIHIDVYNKQRIGFKNWIVLRFCNSIARIMSLFTKTVTPAEVRSAFNPSDNSVRLDSPGAKSRLVRSKSEERRNPAATPSETRLSLVPRSKSEEVSLGSQNPQGVKTERGRLVEKESSFESDEGEDSTISEKPQIESSDEEDSFESTASTLPPDEISDSQDTESASDVESGDEEVFHLESDAKVGKPDENQDQDLALEALYNS